VTNGAKPDDTGASRFMMVLIAVFFSAAVLYSITLPRWINSDEPYHYFYIRTILSEKRLPTHKETYQAAHPPLYYLAAAAWALPFASKSSGFQDNWLRLLSGLFGTLTVFLIYRIGRDCLNDAWLGVGMAVFAVVNPAFVVMNSVVNNDPCVILACTMAIYLMLKTVGPGTGVKTAAICGAAAGLCCLVKITANLLPVFFFFFYVFHPANRERGVLRIACELAVFGVTFCAVCLWFYAMSFSRIGDKALFNPVNALHPNPLYVPGNLIWFLKSHALNFWLPQDYIRGYPKDMHIAVKAAYFLLSSGLLILIPAGLIDTMRSSDKLKRHVFLCFAVCLAVYFAQMYVFNMKVPVAQARYMYIVIAPAAALVMYPLQGALRKNFRLFLYSACVIAVVTHVVWAFYCFLPIRLPDLGI